MADLFWDMGYGIEFVGRGTDFGGDILTVNSNWKLLLIQTKRYSDPVGIKAVQEVVGALRWYQAHQGVIITTNSFTPAAMDIAIVNDVCLIDRDQLDDLTKKWKRCYVR